MTRMQNNSIHMPPPPAWLSSMPVAYKTANVTYNPSQDAPEPSPFPIIGHHFPPSVLCDPPLSKSALAVITVDSSLKGLKKCHQDLTPFTCSSADISLRKANVQQWLPALAANSRCSQLPNDAPNKRTAQKILQLKMQGCHLRALR